MKKLLMALMVAILSIGVVQARDKVEYNDASLPQMAKNTLKKNFKVGVNHIKIDKGLLGDVDYDVVLKDGTEIEFDKDGNWTSVEAKGGVPNSMVLPSILHYVKSNYGKSKIVQIDVNRNDYEVELSNGIELKFDRSGRFLRVDN